MKSGLNKQELSWVLYDVGNSAFVLVMVTTIMPIFFKDVAAASMSAAQSTAWWGYANAGASLIVALFAPVVGTLADYQGYKKRVFSMFWLTGVVCTLLLSLFGAGSWPLCLFLFALARVGWSGTNIVYDSLLVDVAGHKRMDRLSSYGYGWGYIGSVVPFLAIIALVMSAMAGTGSALPVRETQIAFVIVALWWVVFTLPLLRNVKQRHWIPGQTTPISSSFERLWGTLRAIRAHRQAFIFLLAYFFFIDGVSTVITMATAYGRDLEFSAGMLVVVILFIQLVAFPFALLFAKLAERFSTKRMLLAGIYVYCVITVLAFLMPSVDNHSVKSTLFWLMALLVGSAMGGVQALSRSYFAKLIPAENSGEFFGFYNIVGKFAAIMGPLLVGIIGSASGHSPGEYSACWYCL